MLEILSFHNMLTTCTLFYSKKLKIEFAKIECNTLQYFQSVALPPLERALTGLLPQKVFIIIMGRS